jgi:hypothetical protein
MYTIPAGVWWDQLQQSCCRLHWQIREAELLGKEEGTAAAVASSPAGAPEAATQAPCALMPAHHHWLHAGYSSSAVSAAVSHLLHPNRHNMKANSWHHNSGNLMISAFIYINEDSQWNTRRTFLWEFIHTKSNNARKLRWPTQCIGYS